MYPVMTCGSRVGSEKLRARIHVVCILDPWEGRSYPRKSENEAVESTERAYCGGLEASSCLENRRCVLANKPDGSSVAWYCYCVAR